MVFARMYSNSGVHVTPSNMNENFIRTYENILQPELLKLC